MAFHSDMELSKMKIEKKKWSEVSSESISMEAIQRLHSPREHYRFTRDGYPEGAHFIGTMSIPAVIYVLEGKIKYVIDNEEMLLAAGEVAEFDRCDYVSDVIGTSGVSFIRVTHLPEKLRT
jgi:ethanolamine utilization protein EutQ (cupin superfamily)